MQRFSLFATLVAELSRPYSVVTFFELALFVVGLIELALLTNGPIYLVLSDSGNVGLCHTVEYFGCLRFMSRIVTYVPIDFVIENSNLAELSFN